MESTNSKQSKPRSNRAGNNKGNKAKDKPKDQGRPVTREEILMWQSQRKKKLLLLMAFGPVMITICAFIAFYYAKLSDSELSFGQSLVFGDLLTLKLYKEIYQFDFNQIMLGDEDSRYPLHAAVLSNRTDVVEYLLSNGAEVNSLDQNEWNPVHYCAFVNNYEICNLLIDHGGCTSCVDTNGRTPLHIAALKKSNEAAISIMEDFKAKLFIKDVDGNDPLSLSMSLDNKELTRSLVNAINERKENKAKYKMLEARARQIFPKEITQGKPNPQIQINYKNDNNNNNNKEEEEGKESESDTEIYTSTRRDREIEMDPHGNQ